MNFSFVINEIEHIQTLVFFLKSVLHSKTVKKEMLCYLLEWAQVIMASRDIYQCSGPICLVECILSGAPSQYCYVFESASVPQKCLRYFSQNVSKCSLSITHCSAEQTNIDIFKQFKPQRFPLGDDLVTLSLNNQQLLMYNPKYVFVT